MVQIICPRCHTTMPYLAELAGRQIFCLGCGLHFEVPQEGEHVQNPSFQAVKVSFAPPNGGGPTSEPT